MNTRFIKQKAFLLSLMSFLMFSGISKGQSMEQIQALTGMSQEQIIQQASSAGVDVSNFGSKSTKEATPAVVEDSNKQREVENDTKKVEIISPTPKSAEMLKIFGSELFSKDGATMPFETNLKMATPKNYVLGPQDHIVIEIFGTSQVTYKLEVSPEGTINVPYAGVLSVNGLTIEQLNVKIKKQLARVYTDINSGKTHVNVTLGNIRSIKVTILGEANKPGTYTLPSLASAFNALYAAGGPNEKGSYRNIEIIRGNRVVSKLDVYDFLLKGDSKHNLRLEDQDVIRIPVYQTRVEFSGEVKRSGLYEVIVGETFKDVLGFAGGFSDNAYSARVQVVQKTDKEYKITDLFSKDFAKYKPQRADKYIVDPILDRYENRVTLQGAVYRPGTYELESNMKLSQLLKKADGVKEDAFKNRGIIKRLKPDMTREMLSFDLGQVLTGKSDELLKREDEIIVLSILEIRKQPIVTIKGQVKKEGTHPFAEGMTVEDLILLSGGLNVGASPNRVEVSRRVILDSTDVTKQDAQTTEIYQVDLNEGFGMSVEKFYLQPYDIVTVRNQVGYERQKLVRIDGQVMYPGIYSLNRKNERISDIVKRAGGLTPIAYLPGASLKRVFYKKSKDERKTEELLQISTEKEVSITLNTTPLNVIEDHKIDNVYVDMPGILKKPGSQQDLILQEGDVITVPKQMQTVNITGAVNAPGNTTYEAGMSFKNYVAQAGGVLPLASLRRAYVKYPNGRVKTTKQFCFVNFYPKVVPGSDVVVPMKSVAAMNVFKDAITTLGGLGTLATAAATVYALIKK